MADFAVKRISAKLGGERGARKGWGQTSSHDLVEHMEFLYVRVQRATDYSTNPVGFPIVVIRLGNDKASTESLPIKPNLEWEQVFAFDKSKGDVLSVTIEDGNANPRTVLGKKNFKVAADIPTRISPDSPWASDRYWMKNSQTGQEMELVMSVWFGTQADDKYENAWFSDAFNVLPSGVENTRAHTYDAKRLCYVRMTIVSGHDLIANDGKRAPSCYVSATLGNQCVKTEAASGNNPSWGNRDLILIASHPLDGVVKFKLMDRVDEAHEECIATLEKNVSEMTPLKIPSSAPALFYALTPASKPEPAGDANNFASRIKMKLSTDQSYHVFDECSQYCSDYRAYATSLWPGKLGKLEIGILGATGLPLMKTWDTGKKSVDAYVVAKYGNQWVRTRTVTDSASPKWNEQHSWDVYERCTVVTLGVYDNTQVSVANGGKDLPIGKVRIPLSSLEWNSVYTNSFPLLVVGKEGLKKKGELQLAIRCVCVADMNARIKAPFTWMLPKSHYKTPFSLFQNDYLRERAVEVLSTNLANNVPPLRSEVVMDMLKPPSKSFSMRKLKAEWDRILNIGTDSIFCRRMYTVFAWLQANIITTDNPIPKLLAIIFIESILMVPTWFIVWILSWCMYPAYTAFGIYCLWELKKFLERQGCRIIKGKEAPPPLMLFDVKLSKLESPNLDELAEEFDTFPAAFPASEWDTYVLRMRYDRCRKILEKLSNLLGDIASQGERIAYLCSYFNNPFHLVCFFLVVINILCIFPCWSWIAPFLFYWANFKQLRNDLPPMISNFFRRLPSKAHLKL